MKRLPNYIYVYSLSVYNNKSVCLQNDVRKLDYMHSVRSLLNKRPLKLD